MAWQVKTRYTGAPSAQSVLKIDDGTGPRSTIYL